jgi:aspartate/glutamate racemase
MVTKLLEKAFTEVSKLPAQEQDTLAAIIFEELASERRWKEAFSASTEVLAELADEALAEHHEGRTQELDPDRL